MRTLRETVHKPDSEEQVQETERQDAAMRIQKAWRKKMRQKYLEPDMLWSDLAIHSRMKVDRDAAEQGKDTSRDRWRRGVFLAKRLQNGNSMRPPSMGQDESPDAAKKHLETQHWLELTDGKHRYGSNLKYYHERWDQDDTTENFFKWLDYGRGKDLSLKDCPREQLEKERITYLSREQRLNYLVNIDNSGKLRWAKNGQLVDTTAGRWKDAGGGKGIIPLEYPAGDQPPTQRDSFDEPPPSSTPDSNTSMSGAEADAMMHYVGVQKQSENPIKRVFLKNFTLRGLLEKLLRKTVKRNTWIYVSDKNFNIFVGIKDTGTFQHSSFLAGGLVTSAGLISVKNGLIHTLSPLSGHYRTSIEHFKRFLTVLEERGVDMSKVQISKAELALWGIEHLTKFKKKQSETMKFAKQEAVSAAKQVAASVPSRSRSEDTSWKRQILEGRGVLGHKNRDTVADGALNARMNGGNIQQDPVHRNVEPSSPTLHQHVSQKR